MYVHIARCNLGHGYEEKFFPVLGTKSAWEMFEGKHYGRLVERSRGARFGVSFLVQLFTNSGESKGSCNYRQHSVFTIRRGSTVYIVPRKTSRFLCRLAAIDFAICSKVIARVRCRKRFIRAESTRAESTFLALAKRVSVYRANRA